MRCYSCGSEFTEGMAFCQRCGAPLRGPKPGDPYGTAQLQPTRSKAGSWPMFTPFLGLIIAGLGVVLYFLGLRDTINDVTDPNYDPFGEGNGPNAIFDMMLASFVVMGIGGIVFFGGLIWLVVRSD